MWVNYSVVTQLDRQTPAYQTPLFLHTIGPSGLEIYDSYVLANNEKSQEMADIIRVVESYAIGEKNETYE